MYKILNYIYVFNSLTATNRYVWHSGCVRVTFCIYVIQINILHLKYIYKIIRSFCMGDVFCFAISPATVLNMFTFSDIFNLNSSARSRLKFIDYKSLAYFCKWNFSNLTGIQSNSLNNIDTILQMRDNL